MQAPKQMILGFALLMSATFSLSAQTSVDVHIGFSPTQNIGSQHIRVNYDGGKTNGLLRPSRQSAGLTVGLGFTHDMPSGLFLKGELQYVYSKIRYEMSPVQPPNERNSVTMFYESNHVISIPLSAGVRLGSFRVISGININTRLKSSTTLENLKGFGDDSSSSYLGWQAGLEYNLGNFGLEVRYSQDFANHAQGYAIDGKELIYYGNRSRWTVMAKYYLGGT